MGAIVRLIKGLLARLDRLQRRTPPLAAAWAVNKKFGDDNAGLLNVGLGWYGFTAIYPLMLVVVTVFGFVGEASLGNGVIRTLHQFPVIGAQFTVNPNSDSRLHGSILGLIIGLLGLIYGATGVTRTAQQAMNQVWNVPQVERPGFLPRLGRAAAGLVIIGGAFVINAAVAGYATSGGQNFGVRVGVIVGLLALNTALYALEFRILTPNEVGTRSLVPGSILGGVSFTLLITVGTGLIEHQLRNDSSTYGAFGAIIGVVAFLLLLAKLSLYAAELNPVLHHRYYPRAMPTGRPTEADHRVYAALAEEQRRRKAEDIDVDFDEEADHVGAAPAGGRS